MRTIHTNPYIAGNPVGGTSIFFGRDDIVREVFNLVASPTNNALVLYGQRRIGKTSILLELEQRLSNRGNNITIYYDLQDKASLSLFNVLDDLKKHISDGVGLALKDKEADFKDKFLPYILSNSQKSNIILLFDEFDVLDSDIGGNAGDELFPYLRQVMNIDRQRLNFIFVIGRRPDDLTSTALSIFKTVTYKSVSLLFEEDYLRLVKLPDHESRLDWDNSAIKKIWNWTNGHPYFTQQICSVIWDTFFDEDSLHRYNVKEEDVDGIINQVLERGTNAFEWIWKGLPTPERLVASVLATARDKFFSVDKIEEALTVSTVRVLARDLNNAIQSLKDWDLIEGINGGYKFRVELLRYWFEQRKPLSRVQEEIERKEPAAEKLFQAADVMFTEAKFGIGSIEQALNLAKNAISTNPNHLKARLLLARILLLKNQTDEALHYLEEACNYDPKAANPLLIDALIQKANSVSKREDRLSYYNKILEIQPSHIIAEKERINILKERALRIERRAKEYERDWRLERAYSEYNMLCIEFKDVGSWKDDLDRIIRKRELKTVYEKGIDELENNEIELARETLYSVVAEAPDYPPDKPGEALSYYYYTLTKVDYFSKSVTDTIAHLTMLNFEKEFDPSSFLKFNNIKDFIVVAQQFITGHVKFWYYIILLKYVDFDKFRSTIALAIISILAMPIIFLNIIGIAFGYTIYSIVFTIFLLFLLSRGFYRSKILDNSVDGYHLFLALLLSSIIPLSISALLLFFSFIFNFAWLKNTISFGTSSLLLILIFILFARILPNNKKVSSIVNRKLDDDIYHFSLFCLFSGIICPIIFFSTSNFFAMSFCVIMASLIVGFIVVHKYVQDF